MKNSFLIPLLVLVLTGLILAGCTQPAATPTPEASPAPTSTPAPASVSTPKPTPTQVPTSTPEPASTPQKVYHLKFNHWGPSAISIGKLLQDWADMIEERSDGRVEITCYFGQALLKYADTYRGVSAGIADVSHYTIGTSPGIHDINSVVTLPFINYPGMEEATQIYNDLRKKFPELDKENTQKNTMWLGVRAMAPSQLHLVDRQARVPADLAGAKVISSGSTFTTMLKAINAAQVSLGPPDWYMALERQLAQAQLTHWCVVYERQLLELFKYHTNFGPSGVTGAATIPFGYLVNLDTWNSLPADIQKIMLDTMEYPLYEGLKGDIDLVYEGMSAAEEMGNTITNLTPEERDAWAVLAQPYIEQWIAETEAKGWPAQKIYDGLVELVEEYY